MSVAGAHMVALAAPTTDLHAVHTRELVSAKAPVVNVIVANPTINKAAALTAGNTALPNHADKVVGAMPAAAVPPSAIAAKGIVASHPAALAGAHPTVVGQASKVLGLVPGAVAPPLAIAASHALNHVVGMAPASPTASHASIPVAKPFAAANLPPGQAITSRLGSAISNHKGEQLDADGDGPLGKSDVVFTDEEAGTITAHWSASSEAIESEGIGPIKFILDGFSVLAGAAGAGEKAIEAAGEYLFEKVAESLAPTYSAADSEPATPSSPPVDGGTPPGGVQETGTQQTDSNGQQANSNSEQSQGNDAKAAEPSAPPPSSSDPAPAPSAPVDGGTPPGGTSDGNSSSDNGGKGASDGLVTSDSGNSGGPLTYPNPDSDGGGHAPPWGGPTLGIAHSASTASAHAAVFASVHLNTSYIRTA
ncbi:MAG TPA: hypothetical protein VE988_13650 [Gemmataceae bacterium]|nr:hypothetical protein [Gemmataceae bacterium]